MVDFLEHGLSHHIAEELSVEDEAADMKTRLERAFLMADIHSRKVGVLSSGATVACCLIKVRKPVDIPLVYHSHSYQTTSSYIRTQA